MEKQGQNNGSKYILHKEGCGRYFACVLHQVVRADNLLQSFEKGAEGAQKYHSDLTRRHAEFITSLIDCKDERLTYEIRIVSKPDAALYTRGRIILAMICRMECHDDQAVTSHARGLLNFLTSYFPEYEFRLASRAALARLLSPFSPNYGVSIVRRTAMAALDTLKEGKHRPRRVGFRVQDEPAQQHSLEGTKVFHVFPFIPPPMPHNDLYKLLLLERAPVAICIRLRPTWLKDNEEKILQDQIGICERYMQCHLATGLADVAELHPALQEQAKMYQGYQVRALYGLRDNTALMTVDAVSSKPFSQHIPEALGNLLTEPAGGYHSGVQDSDRLYLAGGYDILESANTEASIAAFLSLDFCMPRTPDCSEKVGRLPFLFDSMEATTAFRLPTVFPSAPWGISAREYRTKPAPSNLPNEGSLVGVSNHGGISQEVRITADDRKRHVYMIGQTGTGKTTLLTSMVLDDIRSGKGVCFIDPHGDAYTALRAAIPENRIDDVVIIDPTDTDYPVGLNLLEYRTPEQRHFIVQEFVGIIRRLMDDEYGAAGREMTGPIFFQHMRMNMLLAMSNPANPGTLMEFYNIYQSKNYWKRWIPLAIEDPMLLSWTRDVLPNTDYLRRDNDNTSMGSYLGSKFDSFLFDPRLRYIFGQKRSTIDFGELMNSGKILLVNLAKGRLSEENARFLGMIILAKFMGAALERVTMPERLRKDFYLYVDEFQSMATQNFITMLSEARKFGLCLVLANQFVSQIRDERITRAIFGNVGSKVCFRLGQDDAKTMESEFLPTFNQYDLSNLPNWNAYMSTLVHNQKVPPFSIETVQPADTSDPIRLQKIIVKSRMKYAKKRADVEKEIAESMQESQGGRTVINPVSMGF